MKHNFRRVIAASVASLAIIAPLSAPNGLTNLVRPITASALVSGFDGIVEKQTASGIKLKFSVDDSNNTCSVVGSDITVSAATVTVPDTITYNGKTYTVTSVGYLAFENQTNLRSIKGGKYIRTIEAGAFRNCTELWNISLFNGTYTDGNPKGSVETIKECAFENCTGIKDTHFLQSAKYIGAHAFWGSGIGNVFLRDVYSIGQAAFYDCTKVSNISLCGSHLKNIPDFAFYNCKNTNSISLPNSVKTIGKNAFANCDRVEELVLPNSVKKIDTGAFMECDRLKTVDTYHIEEVKDHAFFNCPKMIKFSTSYKDTALGEYSLGWHLENTLPFKNTGFYIEAPAGGATQAYAYVNGMMLVVKS
jgi:hypothetical protein